MNEYNTLNINDLIDSVFYEWELTTGNADDIQSAMFEMFMQGVYNGRRNQELVNDAEEIVPKYQYTLPENRKI